MKKYPRVELQVVKDNAYLGGGIQVFLEKLDSENSGTGYRIIGPKPTGDCEDLRRTSLSENDIDTLIQELKSAKKFLKGKK